MRSPGSGLWTWSLTAAVAIVAVSLAAGRPESAPSASVAIVGACVAAMACRGYAEAIALREARGSVPGRWQRGALTLASAGLAALIIVLLLLIGGLMLTRILHHKSQVEDCLMAGRRDCDHLISGAR